MPLDKLCKMNWVDPLLWPAIHAAGIQIGLSSSMQLIQYIHTQYSYAGTYASLQKSTVD